MRTFREFWPHYLAQHSKAGTRVLHLVGTTLALTSVVLAVVTRRWWFLACAPIVGYGSAWIGHFFVEKNRPATFRHPFWSLGADFKMYALWVAGRLGERTGSRKVGQESSQL